MEDHSDIERLKRQIAAAAELAEEENQLLKEENRIRAEKTRNAERTLLYDKVDVAIRRERSDMEALLRAQDRGSGSEEALQGLMIDGVLIKRKVNLLLLGEGGKALSLWEFYYAAKEVCEYVSCAGVSCGVIRPEGEVPEVPGHFLQLAFDLMEELILKEYAACSAFQVGFLTGKRTGICFAFDAEGPLLQLPGPEEARKEAGITLSRRREDDTSYYSLEYRDERKEGTGL